MLLLLSLSLLLLLLLLLHTQLLPACCSIEKSTLKIEIAITLREFKYFQLHLRFAAFMHICCCCCCYCGCCCICILQVAAAAAAAMKRFSKSWKTMREMLNNLRALQHWQKKKKNFCVAAVEIFLIIIIIYAVIPGSLTLNNYEQIPSASVNKVRLNPRRRRGKVSLFDSLSLSFCCAAYFNLREIFINFLNAYFIGCTINSSDSSQHRGREGGSNIYHDALAGHKSWLQHKCYTNANDERSQK